MKHVLFKYKLYDWYVSLLWGVKGQRDFDVLTSLMWENGLCESDITESIDNLRRANSAVTVSNFEKEHTIVAFGRQTSSDEAYNSFVHELRHITEHICEARHIDPRSEEAAYVQGDIGCRLFRYMGNYLCPCCNPYADTPINQNNK